MIRELELQDFKGHRSTVVPLDRFTLLVGDNGSGKSSVLDALRLQSAILMEPKVLTGDDAPDDLLRRGSTGPIVLRSSGEQMTSEISIERRLDREWTVHATMTVAQRRFEGVGTPSEGFVQSSGSPVLVATLGLAALYSFNARRIAQPAYSSDPNAFVDSDGENTAVALAALKLGDDERFDALEASLRRLVPAVERIRIRPAKVGGYVGQKLYFDFKGAADVPAHHASHGTLIALSLLTVLYGPHPPTMVLLDDMDHALHPRAQVELVRLLRELVSTRDDVQIVATTHSPYILDEIDAKDVQVFALRDDGTVASRRLSDHPEKDANLTAGQLWSLDRERDWVLQ